MVVAVDGRPQVIEYSDLPPELASRREPEGRLELSAGSIAIHVLERSFIERIVAQQGPPVPSRDQESALHRRDAASWSSPPSPTA